MDVPERRQLERAAPERLVYIDLQPDNGGIVLNVSDGGLCFQAVAPVKKHQSFSVSFSDQKLGTDAVGEVVWTDETRKFAGLRFTRVSAEARNEIEELLRFVPKVSDVEQRSPTPVLFRADDEGTTTLVASSNEQLSPLVMALLREASGLPPRSLDDPTNIVVRPSTIVPERFKLAQRLKLPSGPSRAWLSRVLIAALVLYAVVASIALYRYRRAQHVPQPGSAALPAPQVTPATPTVANSKPARHRAVARHHNEIVTTAEEPERPLIKAAPVMFDYPTVADGAPSGTVHLKVLISSTGSVEDVKVLAGKRGLARASAQAVRRWRYRALELDGHPVPAEAHVRVHFTGDEAVSIDFRE